MNGGTSAVAAAGLRLPDALRDPAAYPEPTGDLQVVETHVSWIALAGAYAYKLKKPVRFDFLDYSTRELRVAACRTELELNRRWAPALYVDLQWLVPSVAGARFVPQSGGDPGAVAEPAVRMRRFDRTQELDVLVARGAVEAAELAALGERVAGWQRTAPVAGVDSPFGRADDARRAALDTFDVLRGPSSPLDARRVARLEAWVAAAHDDLAPWFDVRRRAGCVRECHGDLHCRNVVRLGAELTPFDAIDFAPPLRWIDVASDSAFLAMDLEQFGRADLAHAFLDAWFAASGDYGAARGLPWLIAYRALVRAKVDALRASQLPEGPDAGAAWRECERFVRLAESCATRPRGRLYATTGASGSGKSWLAARLVPALPAIRLRSDVERKRLAGLGALDASGSAPDAGLYAPAHGDATYARLAASARDLLLAGYDVVVDAANLTRAQRARFRALADELGTGLSWLDCTAPESLLRERVAARRGDPSEATVEVLERQLARREPLDEHERARAVLARTDAPVDVPAIAAALRAAAAPPAGSSPASAPAT